MGETTISKHLIQTHPADVEVLEVIDTEQPTVEAHRTDSLIRVRLGDEEALVHCKFQTTDSTPPMPQRMAGYIGRGVEQHGRPIYLRPAAGQADPGHYVQERLGQGDSADRA